ncbi:hypothetical protein FH620_35255 [Corallococcus exiguus]|nr:hypothetical protein FH620_35255 [Corallococcus exiguus]
MPTRGAAFDTGRASTSGERHADAAGQSDPTDTTASGPGAGDRAARIRGHAVVREGGRRAGRPGAGPGGGRHGRLLHRRRARLRRHGRAHAHG